jgi:membrane protease subunit (stomatin/prohibitin family)
MEFISVLKWDAPPNVFAFKFPNTEITTKSQLIVAESQEAYLFKEGEMVGPFAPGRHVLDTKNFPVLTKWMTNLITGGLSPFTAEVWFVNKAIPLNVRWGTPDPIQVQDAKYGVMLPVRAFGQYGAQVNDGGKFLVKLVGSMPAFTERTLTTYFRGILLAEIKSVLGSYLIDKKISVLEMSSRLSEISEFLNGRLTARLEPYGLRMLDFSVSSISTAEDDPAVKRLKEALARKAEMSILGYSYQQERSFDVMQKAAANEGAGIAPLMGAGMGMGMGMGMGVPMGAAAGAMAQTLAIPQSQSAPMQVCPSCRHSIPGNSRFCPECGHSCTAPSKPEIRCFHCSSVIAAGAKFCPGCGKPFHPCPSCGASLPPDAAVCPSCGNPLPVRCANCGTEFIGKFCPNCGTPGGVAPTIPPTPSPAPPPPQAPSPAEPVSP